MRVLGIDGALGGFSVALLDGEAAVEATSARPDALEAGLGRIAEVLARAGRDIADIDRLAVGIGPGSFTGVRIAIAYAKAFAFARAMPLVGVSSYDVLTPVDAPPAVLTVVHGRPGVISARLRSATAVRTASGAVAEVLAIVLDDVSGEIAVAGAVEDVRSAIAERGIVVRALSPRAETPARAVARIASTMVPGASPHAVAPDYGEAPAAQIRAGR
jgi:tRNA threonylcarbamoyl adenosine modification protein YeaZ